VDAGENVRREIGPECSLVAAVMAESVEGAREESDVGSATTSVELARREVVARGRSWVVRRRADSIFDYCME